MTETQAINFDADARKVERQQSEITIGGKKFRPAPKTPERMDRYFDELPEKVYKAEELRTNMALLKEFQKLDAQTTYKQLAIVLLDAETGDEADYDFLRQELEEQDADDLLELLVPSKREVARQGNSGQADEQTA